MSKSFLYKKKRRSNCPWGASAPAPRPNIEILSAIPHDGDFFLKVRIKGKTLWMFKSDLDRHIKTGTPLTVQKVDRNFNHV